MSFSPPCAMKNRLSAPRLGRLNPVNPPLCSHSFGHYLFFSEATRPSNFWVAILCTDTRARSDKFPHFLSFAPPRSFLISPLFPPPCHFFSYILSGKRRNFLDCSHLPFPFPSSPTGPCVSRDSSFPPGFQCSFFVSSSVPLSLFFSPG